MPTALAATGAYLAANSWWIGPTVAAVGAGVGVYGSMQSAATSKNIANYNYSMQQRNAKMQLMANTAQVQQMEQQARFQKAQAEINARLAENEAQARSNNAETMRNQALAQASADRENIRRTNEDSDRSIAIMRAKMGKTGADLGAGSMLETYVEAEKNKKVVAQELGSQSRHGYMKTFAEVALEEFGAATARAGAQLDLATGRAEANLSRSAAALQEVTGRSEYLMNRKKAEMARMSGYADAKGATMQAWGSLFSGLSSFAGSFGSRPAKGQPQSWWPNEAGQFDPIA
ncbi:hypothetical protein [Verrucomicrobium sp. BvORR034]|uniref:hypothetical protein n=1 Tax=Verrucomicrobium sp. BvORR034 TaxID=1396418 RepID=UPI002240EC6E|nr:hypothetical protein [Verrucomicrobium sp. BvORR034]